MNQHVNLTFSLKYLVNFSKSASLSNVVQLMMSNDVPLLVRTSLSREYIDIADAPCRSRTTSTRGTSGTISRLKLETTERDHHFCLAVLSCIDWSCMFSFVLALFTAIYAYISSVAL